MPNAASPDADTQSRAGAASSWGLQVRWMMWFAALGYCAYLYVRGTHLAQDPGSLQTTFPLFAMWILPLSFPFLLFGTWRHWRKR